MELKGSYLDETIGLIPWTLFSSQVEARAREVHERLKNYW